MLARCLGFALGNYEEYLRASLVANAQRAALGLCYRLLSRSERLTLIYAGEHERERVILVRKQESLK